MAEATPTKCDMEGNLTMIKSLSEKKIRKLMQRNYETLVENLILHNGILTHLYSKNVITLENKENIQSEYDDSKQIEMLLDILIKKGKNAIIQFLEALRDNDHRHVLRAVFDEQAQHLSKPLSERLETEEKDVGILIQEKLKDRYRQNMAYIRCNPLDPDANQPFEELYVPLALVMEEVNYPAGQKKTKTPLQHYCDIFADQSKGERTLFRILIQGKPGVGKTILTKRLAIDWAEGREKSLSERFENVFVLNLSKVKPGQTVVDVVAEQLLPYKSPLVAQLETYITESSKKCLFIFDGLDEMKQGTSIEIDKMIQHKYLSNTCLVITSRPSQAQHLTITSKFDQHARIEGFKKENIVHFVEKFFGEHDNVTREDVGDSNPDSGHSDKISTGLLDEIKNKRLSNIAKIPLLLNILCLLYIEQRSLPKHGSLPDTVSKIYKRLQQLLCRRKKDSYLENEAILEDILEKLGKLAFEIILEGSNQLYFSKKTILKEVGEEAFKIGLVWTEKDKYELEPQACFLHKSFQEYAAAFYLGRETDKNNHEPWEKFKTFLDTKRKMKDLDFYMYLRYIALVCIGRDANERAEQVETYFQKVRPIVEQELFLQFCSGASLTLAKKILEYLDEKAQEIDPKLEGILHLLNKLSHKKQLSREELEILCNYDYKNMHGVRNFLKLEAKCLCNMETATETNTHLVNRLFDYTEINSSKAYLKGTLIPERCIAFIDSDQHYDFFVQNTTSTLLIKLECNCYSPFSSTKENEKNLHATYDRNQQDDLLLSLRSKHILSWNLCGCDVSVSGLKAIGQVLNQNADTLLQLKFGFSPNLRTHFDQFSQEITQPLSVSVLELVGGLDSQDTEAVRHLLRKSQEVKELHIKLCYYEVSNDILELKHLVVLDISGTVDPTTKEGINVARVLASLGEFLSLETFKANHCQIGDEEMKSFHLKNPTNIITIDLCCNHIEHGILYICKNYKMLQKLRSINMEGNRMKEVWKQIVKKYYPLFKKLTVIHLNDFNFLPPLSSPFWEQIHNSKEVDVWLFPSVQLIDPYFVWLNYSHLDGSIGMKPRFNGYF